MLKKIEHLNKCDLYILYLFLVGTHKEASNELQSTVCDSVAQSITIYAMKIERDKQVVMMKDIFEK